MGSRHRNPTSGYVSTIIRNLSPPFSWVAPARVGCDRVLPSEARQQAVTIFHTADRDSRAAVVARAIGRQCQIRIERAFAHATCPNLGLAKAQAFIT
eukprot:467284-Prorocentrum_minimum.AAC.4